MKRLKFVLITALIVGLCGALCTWNYFLSDNTANFTTASKVVFIHTGSTLEDLFIQLAEQGVVRDMDSFRFTARMKKFRRPKPGRYRFEKGMNNNQMVNMLRSGNQEAVMVPVGSNVRTFHELAGTLAELLEPDSITFIQYLEDPDVFDSLGFDLENFRVMFISDSYSMNWNSTPLQFVQRMKREYDSYWTNERKQAAEALGLNLAEVGILASIVKGETARRDEASKIAGLYLNRLHTGMKLESDPTVEFAIGNEVQRLRYGQIRNTISPYNTYNVAGLPPGPVFFTEAHYLDATLHPENHSYVFMCARPDDSGYHNFSRTYEEHEQYAAEYHRYIENKGLK